MTIYHARLTSNANLPVMARSLLVTLLFLALAASVHAEPLLSAPFLSFDTGDEPQAVAISDLNADGRLDLVTANGGPGANTVSVLLGNGDGTFGLKTDFGTGYNPYSVAIADLNSDGRPDVVTANSGFSTGNTVSVLLGNGDGTFGSQVEFGTGSYPVAVAIADFNADGRPDLAVANRSSNTVSVLLGNGDGTFQAKTDFSTGSVPYAVAIADVNGDGRRDLVVVNSGSNTVSVLLGNGDGTFGTKTDFATGRDPVSVAISDMNADGRPDLAVANASSATVSVLLGNGNGTFAPRTDFVTGGTGSGPASVAIADLNADGRPDLAVANVDMSAPGGSTVAVLLGNGGGTFGPKTNFNTGSNPASVAIADLNADGRPDLATADSYPSTVSVLLGNGDGTFGAAHADFGTGEAPRSVAIADLNGDGRPDLATANSHSPLTTSWSVLLGNGDGTFGAANTNYGTGYEGPYSVAIADLNADGRPDLVVANANVNTVSVLIGNGNSAFGAKTDFATGVSPRSVVIADFNADGRPDLAVANGFSNTVSVLLGNGNDTFRAKTDFGTGDGPVSVAIADLNTDERLDLVTANYYSFTVSVLLGNGDGTFGPNTDFATGSYPYSVALADVNVDGRPDVATANGGSDDVTTQKKVSVLLGNGDGTFGPKADYGVGTSPRSVAIADLNADGRPDLVVTNDEANTVSVLLGNGDGSFGLKTDYGTGVEPLSVAIADLNGDGRPDLAVANNVSNTVTVLLNTGPFPCPNVVMSFDLNPNTLNLHSMGHWVTGTLEPEPPASPSDIDIASIRLNGSVPVDSLAPISIGDADGDGRPDLTVKFSRAAVELAVSEGDSVPVTVTGKIGNGCFSATDVIRVIRGHVTAPAAGVVLQSGGTAEVRWDTPAGIQVQSVAVLFSSDDGATWSLVAHELPNTGSYLWTLRGAATDQARIAVVLVESADPSGYEVVGALEVSDRFAIASPLAVGGTRLDLALQGAVPNPGRELRVSFVLPSGEPASLVVYDVGGREVSRRAVGALGAGRHMVTLAPSGTLAPGVYLVHLVRGDRRLVARAAVVR